MESRGPFTRENPQAKKCSHVGVAFSDKDQERSRGLYRDCTNLGTRQVLGDSRVQPEAAYPMCGRLVVLKHVLAVVRAMEVPTRNLAERSLERGDEGLLVTTALIGEATT